MGLIPLLQWTTVNEDEQGLGSDHVIDGGIVDHVNDPRLWNLEFSEVEYFINNRTEAGPLTVIWGLSRERG